MVRVFLVVALCGVMGCRPEPVPIVATYEPVDCSCPVEAKGSDDEPGGRRAEGAVRAGGGAEEAADADAVVRTRAAGAEETADVAASGEARMAGAGVEETTDAEAAGGVAETGAVETLEPAPRLESEPPVALDPRVELNTASTAELETLPRVGPSTARRIIDYRSRRPFRRPRDLMRVKGIGPKTYARLQDRIVVREDDWVETQ